MVPGIGTQVAVMTCRVGDLVVKAQDPESLSRFWCAALGYQVTEKDEAGVAISGASNAPAILFLRPIDAPGSGTLHFDPCPTDRSQMEELERLLSLGARPAEVVPSGSWLLSCTGLVTLGQSVSPAIG